MIALMIDGCCNGCPHIDLDLKTRPEVIVHDEDGFVWAKTYRVCCRHQEVCGFLHEEMAAHPLAADPED